MVQIAALGPPGEGFWIETRNQSTFLYDSNKLFHKYKNRQDFLVPLACKNIRRVRCSHKKGNT
ncbi:MAG: hypothetical protein ACK559_15835, partial [bacterium]